MSCEWKGKEGKGMEGGIGRSVLGNSAREFGFQGGSNRNRKCEHDFEANR